MKALIALLAMTICGASFATAVQPRKTIIYCTQSDSLNSNVHHTIKIDSQEGRAANYISVDAVSSVDGDILGNIANKLIDEERGSIEEGQVIHDAKEAGILTINYPEKGSKLNYLPSIYETTKEDNLVAIQMRCTHL